MASIREGPHKKKTPNPTHHLKIFPTPDKNEKKHHTRLHLITISNLNAENNWSSNTSWTTHKFRVSQKYSASLNQLAQKHLTCRRTIEKVKQTQQQQRSTLTSACIFAS